MTETTIIVGAGPAGGRCAEELLDAGYQGQIILIGDDSYEPYERRPLSKALLAGAVEPARLMLRQAEAYRIEGVDLRLREFVSRIDRANRQVLLRGGEKLGYDRLVLATGGRARRLGGKDQHVHYLRTLDDALKLRRNLEDAEIVGIVGGGLVGLETAATIARLGYAVTVVEASPTLIPGVASEELAGHIVDLHRRSGVEVLLNCRATDFLAKEDGAQLRLSDGQTLLLDVMIVALGAQPNIELAVSAGLAVEGGGVVTDEFGCTSDPNIFAIGDIAMQWHPVFQTRLRVENQASAYAQARSVAATLAGQRTPCIDIPTFETNQFGISIEITGLIPPDARMIWRGHPAVGPAIGFVLYEGRLIGAASFNSGREMRALHYLISEGIPLNRDALANPHISLSALTGGAVALNDAPIDQPFDPLAPF
jgi:3-phenylpropionate/trans-cinnamate dioxygenase ferredoxin reductase subunit